MSDSNISDVLKEGTNKDISNWPNTFEPNTVYYYNLILTQKTT
jgi:hypothetical protein